MPWVFLGQGQYNEVYTDAMHEADRRFILKVQRQRNFDATIKEIDLPKRSVRLWNLINPDISPQATIELVNYTTKTREKIKVMAWKCPYIRGRQANDHEIACELVRIFNETGRIITDAVSPQNFIHTPEGRTVCVDIGMALELEHRDETELVSLSVPHLRRQKSTISLIGWQTLHNNYISYFAKEKKRCPETIKIIQALLLIKNNNIDIDTASFLLTSPLIRRNIGNAYIAQQILQLSEEVLTLLGSINDGHLRTTENINQLEKLSKHCLELIDDYLHELSLTMDSRHNVALNKVQMSNLHLAFSELSPASLPVLLPKASSILANIRQRLREASELQDHINSAFHDLAPLSTRNSEPAGAGGAGAGYDSTSSDDTIIHATGTKHSPAIPIEFHRMKVSCDALIQSYMDRMSLVAANKGKPKAILRAAEENLAAGKNLLRLFDTSKSLREVQQSVRDFRLHDPDLAYVKKQCADILESELTL